MPYQDLASRIGPKPGITFAVDAVEPAQDRLKTESLLDSLNWRFRRGILVLPEQQEQVIHVDNRCHPLVEAVHRAFATHRPLALSPDDIWLVIAQGFGHHIAENAKRLRGRLVRHEGHRELTVFVTELSPESYEQAIGSFSSQIREATDPVLHETLICNFSTTEARIRTASEIAMMDSYATYFSYVMGCVCGIPKVTLQGTEEDWTRIRERIEVMATYELEWWVKSLRPILDEFITTAAGRPNAEFWKAIYKPEAVYGGEVATGWITDLFPYLGDAPYRQKKAPKPRKGWNLGVKFGVRPDRFPSGLSNVSVRLCGKTGGQAGVDFVGGFFGVRQDSEQGTLSPYISWAIAEPTPDVPLPVYQGRS